jgi:hypothetical protein
MLVIGGEVRADFVDRLDIKDGQVLSIVVVS